MAGKRLLEPDYTLVIQYSKTRRRVKLGTANKTTAAQTAASFYRGSIQKGWQGVTPIIRLPSPSWGSAATRRSD